MNIADLDTPALLIDLDVMERNIARMAAYTKGHGLHLRPHTKTHKIPEIARQQLAAGARGITVAKTGEAEVMVAAGLDDVFVAYPLVTPAKQQRLARLAREARIRTSFDSLAAAEGLSHAATDAGSTIHVLIDLDTGNGRTGLRTIPDLVDLARRVADMPGLHYEGLFVYPGHMSLPAAERDPLIAPQRALVDEAIAALADAGLRPEVVSGGTTPAAEVMHRLGNVTEIRPGTYVFNDRNTVVTGSCTADDCAGSVLVTVVSRHGDDLAIIDGGSKTFTAEPARPPLRGHGASVDYPGAIISRMNEEHGFLDLTGAERKPAVGDTVRIVPNHICCTVNQFVELHGVRGDRVEVTWPVAARGQLR